MGVMVLVVCALLAELPANALAPDASAPFSSSASLSGVDFKGWDVGAWAHVSRGVAGGSEGMCVMASRTTYTGEHPVRMVQTREVGCKSRSLRGPFGAARWNRLDATTWEASATGEVRTHIWRDVYVWRGHRRTGPPWKHVETDHTRSRARLELRWVRLTDLRWVVLAEDPNGPLWGVGLAMHARPPVCVAFGPPFVIPCLQAQAGVSRPATVAGRIQFDTLGPVPLNEESSGRLLVYLTPIGSDCEGEC